MEHSIQSAPCAADDPLSDVIYLAPEAQEALGQLVAALARAKLSYRDALASDYARIEKLHRHAFEAQITLCLGMLSDEQSQQLRAKAAHRLGTLSAGVV